MGGPPNKGMKLTSVERNGRSQLIPGVRPTVAGAARGSSPGRTRRERLFLAPRSGCDAP
jgi:hypothetical protein